MITKEDFNKEHGRAITNPHTTEPIKLHNLTEINRRFMGGGMSQAYSALYFFEHYIWLYGFEYVVEIGTQKGALALFFANMASVTEKFLFETYDISNYDYYNRENEGTGHWFDEIVKISKFVEFYNCNIFSEWAIKNIKENISKFKTLIFCDGGDKKKELETFAKFLKSGDHIIVHDWDVEIIKEEADRIVDECGLQYNEPFSGDAILLGTQLMPFIKL